MTSNLQLFFSSFWLEIKGPHVVLPLNGVHPNQQNLTNLLGSPSDNKKQYVDDYHPYQRINLTINYTFKNWMIIVQLINSFDISVSRFNCCIFVSITQPSASTTNKQEHLRISSGWRTAVTRIYCDARAFIKNRSYYVHILIEPLRPQLRSKNPLFFYSIQTGNKTTLLYILWSF